MGTIYQPSDTVLYRGSPAALEEYGNDIMNHPCGTGPYVCTEWEEKDHKSFKRNDDYWGDKPGVDTVTIKEVPEAGARTSYASDR